MELSNKAWGKETYILMSEALADNMVSNMRDLFPESGIPEDVEVSTIHGVKVYAGPIWPRTNVFFYCDGLLMRVLDTQTDVITEIEPDMNGLIYRLSARRGQYDS